jgi:RNA polymerase sigma-70 factor (ECF subfamily)
MEKTGHDEVRQGLAEHLARLWRYALVLSRRRDIAEDLVQATCVRALEKSHQFTPGSRLDRWLFAILHSIWLNDLRSRKARESGRLDLDEAHGAHDGVSAAESTVRARQVLRQVDEMPDGQRAAIFLVCVEGFAYREAAEVLKVPIGTIMSRISSARARLADMAAEPDSRAPSKADKQ